MSLAREARAHFEDRRFDDAERMIEEAQRLCPAARLEHALGRVQQAAGRFADALKSFRRCLAEGAEADRALCAPEVAALEARLSRGVLVVDVLPADAVIELDGVPGERPAGRTEVQAGRVGVRVKAPGHAPLRAVIDVPGGGEARLEARLDPLPAAVPVAPTLPERGAAEPARDDGVVVSGAPSTVGLWVGVGVGVGLLLGSIGPFVQDAMDRRAAKPASETYTGDRVKPTNLIVGGCLAGAGVVALATSLALWPSAPAAVAPVPGGAVVSLGGRW